MFEAVLGLKINVTKSKPIGIDVHDSQLADVAEIFLLCELSSYLGLLLWDPMEEQVEYRLSTWKVKYFSHGGKITLIESALSIFFFHICPFSDVYFYSTSA